MSPSKRLLLASICGFLGVAMGAFGAHGLKHLLSDYRLDIYKTAVHYQMWHTLLLAMTSFMPESRLLHWVGVLLIAGMLLFSGSLYLLALTDVRWLGMITPLGGVAFLGAWGLLVWMAFQQARLK